MAEILEAQGESVLHVVMIDSPNPENCPSFIDRTEHDNITSITYKRVANGINAPGTPVDDDGGSSSDSQDEDDDFSPANLLPRIRRHIHNGLHTICTVQSNHFLPDHCDIPVTLVKCPSIARPIPTLRDTRKEKEFLLKTFRDDLMGSQPAKFEHFDTVKFRAQHDSAFDKAYVGDLTGILRGILASIA